MSRPFKQGRRKWRSRKAKATGKRHAIVLRFHHYMRCFDRAPEGVVKDMWWVLMRATAIKYPDLFQPPNDDTINYPAVLLAKGVRYNAVIHSAS